MNTYKNDSFGSRLATAANARNAALERFRARPGPDDSAVLERQAARKAVSVARDARIGERKARAAALAIAQKSARDARYAARNARRR